MFLKCFGTSVFFPVHSPITMQSDKAHLQLHSITLMENSAEIKIYLSQNCFQLPYFCFFLLSYWTMNMIYLPLNFNERHETLLVVFKTFVVTLCTGADSCGRVLGVCSPNICKAWIARVILRPYLDWNLLILPQMISTLPKDICSIEEYFKKLT